MIASETDNLKAHDKISVVSDATIHFFFNYFHLNRTEKSDWKYITGRDNTTQVTTIGKNKTNNSFYNAHFIAIIILY